MKRLKVDPQIVEFLFLDRGARTRGRFLWKGPLMVGKNTRILAPATIALAVGLAACGGGVTETESAAPAVEDAGVAETDAVVDTPSTEAQASAEDTDESADADADADVTTEPAETTADDEQDTDAAVEPAEPVAEQPEPEIERAEPVVEGISLAQVADATAEVQASRFTMDVRFVGEIEGTSVDADLSIISAQDPDGDIEAVIDFGDLFTSAFEGLSEEELAEAGPFLDAFAAQTEARVVDGVAYSRSGLLGVFLGIDESTWLIDDGSLEGIDTNLGSEDIAVELLDGFAEAETEVIEVGSDQIDGVDVTHYQAQIDPAAIEDFEIADSDLGVDANATLPFDFWVDDDDRIRRFTLSIDGSLIEDTGGDDLEFIEMVGNWSDFGGGFDIVAPDGAVSIDEALVNSDGGLFGDLFTEEAFTEPAE